MIICYDMLNVNNNECNLKLILNNNFKEVILSYVHYERISVYTYIYIYIYIYKIKHHRYQGIYYR